MKARIYFSLNPIEEFIGYNIFQKEKSKIYK
jgi:hypothetical protein